MGNRCEHGVELCSCALPNPLPQPQYKLAYLTIGTCCLRPHPAGSGYVTACMAVMIGGKGQVGQAPGCTVSRLPGYTVNSQHHACTQQVEWNGLLILRCRSLARAELWLLPLLPQPQVVGMDKHWRLVEAAHQNLMTCLPELLDPTRVGLSFYEWGEHLVRRGASWDGRRAQP